MAFKSLAQKQKFTKMLSEGKISQETFDKLSKDSPPDNVLPERINYSPKPIQKIRVIK